MSALVHELLAEAAAARPDAVAVVDGERELSYRELDALSGSLAAALIECGVRPGDRVGLLLEKSHEAVAGVYGALKAGAAYVPLDDQAPAGRLARIAGDAGIRCVVTSAARAGACEKLIAEGLRLEAVVGAPGGAVRAPGPEWLSWEEVAGLDPAAPRASEPDALAYILYTSGSTGQPKGVMLSHANCLAFVEWAASEVGVRAEDRLSSHAPFHFDLSTFDLFAAARGAAAVVLVPRALSPFPVMLARFIAESSISVWYSVPSALTALVLRGELESTPLPALRTVIFAGEVFPIKYLARLMERVPHARYLNFYGPTETNVCTWYEVPHGEPLQGELPIGVPLPAATAVIVGEDGSPVADGEQGELLIGGPTVMRGYWNDPERSARALIEADGVRCYRTGDLVRRRPDGQLMFTGRRDSQVKTRGYRVELGEVEAALNSLGAVAEAAVVAIPDETITNRLKAFVACSEPATEAELLRECRRLLPRHMIPSEIELRPALPKSSTGKIDRRALSKQGLAGTRFDG